MVRRQPRSTLFPTRRSSDLWRPGRAFRGASHLRARASPASVAKNPAYLQLKHGGSSSPVGGAAPSNGSPCFGRIAVLGSRSRSEEHTSELQSRLHLVCRLLL